MAGLSKVGVDKWKTGRVVGVYGQTEEEASPRLADGKREPGGDHVSLLQGERVLGE